MYTGYRTIFFTDFVVFWLLFQRTTSILQPLLCYIDINYTTGFSPCVSLYVLWRLTAVSNEADGIAYRVLNILKLVHLCL
jgi:hypothetical protein